MIGLTVGGRYRIERLLGEGGMGRVYEARHTSTARRVALKLIQAGKGSDDLLKRFNVEAKAAGLIDSEHIAQVLDMGVDDERGTPFLALELLVGEDIGALAKRLGILPPALALRIVGQALRGVAKAHERGVVHRDLKPANLFLAEREGSRHIVKVLDFGIARIRGDHDLLRPGDQNITVTGAMLGTPRYMSPEQTKGLKRTDERTDVWALGVVLYELLSGHAPHPDAESVGDLMVRLCTERSRVRDVAPWVPSATAEVVDKALAIEVTARWQSSGEMLAAIGDLLPEGLDIRDDMLVPLDRDVRATTASRTITSSSSARALAASTPHALSASDGAPRAPSGSRGRPLLAGGALGTVAMGLVAYLVLGSSGAARRADPATSAAVVPTPPSASAPPREAAFAPDRAEAPAPQPSPPVAGLSKPASSAARPSSPRRPGSATPRPSASAAPKERARDPRREL